MDIGPPWLTRPALPSDDATAAAFDELLAAASRRPGVASIDYRLSAPKWQFLCHATDRHGLIAHGSGADDIAVFEPRQANDVFEFGNRRAVYAAADGLWAMFYAVLRRDIPGMAMVNACGRVVGDSGELGPPHYLFSISRHARVREPWRDGTVYLLPSDGFDRQPPQNLDGRTVHSAQAASVEPVVPLAKLAVGPADFPFLTRIGGHDDAELAARVEADPDGFPWCIEHAEPAA